MKKFLIFSLILLFIIIIKRQFSSNYTPIYYQPSSISKPYHDIDIIKEINNNQKQFHSFAGEGKMIINLKLINLTFPCEIYFENPKNFRMKIYGILGREDVDLGCNNDGFWYWSKWLGRNIVHYCSWDNMYRSNLKTAFNPKWIIESIGFSEISQNSEILDAGDKIYLIEKRISTQLEEVNKITIIDKIDKVILGHYILDSNNQLIVSNETLEFEKINNFLVPKKILTNIYEDNVSMIIELNNMKLNEKIDPKLWKMREERTIEIVD